MTSSPLECGSTGAFQRQDGKWFDALTGRAITASRPNLILKRTRTSLPPAYNPAWVCKKPDKIISLGYDKKGRKQATYSEDAVKHREEKKEETMADSLTRLPKIIDRARRYMDAKDPVKMKREDIMLLSILILHDTGIRLGKEDYLVDGTHGLSTLDCKHAKSRGVKSVQDRVVLIFSGKHKVENRVEINSPESVKWMRHIIDTRCETKDDIRLFGIGSWHMHHRTLSRFVTRLTGLSPKTFRTLVANRIFVQELGRNGWDVKDAVRLTSMRLNNSPTVTVNSYIMGSVMEFAEKRKDELKRVVNARGVDEAIKLCLE